MATCLVCPICREPGSLDSAAEKAAVPCNVRGLESHRFVVWRCGSCNSLHSADAADLSFYYDHFPFKRHKLDFHARIGYRNRLKLLKQQGLHRDDFILDYGCGTGLFVEYLREKGYKNTFGYDAYVAPFQDSSVLRREYDAVVSYDLIEHLDDPRALLNGLGDLVKIGGLLALGTPNADHLDLSPESVLAPELSQPYHRHILSERALLSLCEEIGLSVEQVYRRFYFDSLVPTVNTRFMWAYIAASGGVIDAAVEPPNTALVMRSPKLLFYALFGYLFPPRGNVLFSFRKTATARAARMAKSATASAK